MIIYRCDRCGTDVECREDLYKIDMKLGVDIYLKRCPTCNIKLPCCKEAVLIKKDKYVGMDYYYCTVHERHEIKKVKA